MATRSHSCCSSLDAICIGIQLLSALPVILFLFMLALAGQSTFVAIVAVVAVILDPTDKLVADFVSGAPAAVAMVHPIVLVRRGLVSFSFRLTVAHVTGKSGKLVVSLGIFFFPRSDDPAGFVTA